MTLSIDSQTRGCPRAPSPPSQATRVAATIADWLSHFSGEVVRLAPDLDQIPALSVEREAQWARIGAASFLTDAEKRALLGLPPVVDGGV